MNTTATLLHELIAAEKTVVPTSTKLLTETSEKFKKRESYFDGILKQLSFLTEDPANAVISAQEKVNKPAKFTVHEQLEYALDAWAKAEDLFFQKNVARQEAVADIVLEDGTVIMKDVPVDELLGLEDRLPKLRTLLLGVPTLDAGKTWVPDTSRGPGFYRTPEPVVAAKTEKKTEFRIVAQPTQHHQAQVVPINKEEPVGKYETLYFSGAVTTAQLAVSLSNIDKLIVAVGQARQRANQVPVEKKLQIGKTISQLILQPLMPTSAVV